MPFANLVARQHRDNYQPPLNSQLTLPGGDQPRVVFCITEKRHRTHRARASRRRNEYITNPSARHRHRKVPGNWFVPVNRTSVIRSFGAKKCVPGLRQVDK
jgi:hypothetical protein